MDRPIGIADKVVTTSLTLVSWIQFDPEHRLGVRMAYLSPDYAHDVFISYSHGDIDNTGMSDLKAWSQEFARRFESELRLDPKFKNAAVFIDENKRVEHGLDRTL